MSRFSILKTRIFKKRRSLRIVFLFQKNGAQLGDQKDRANVFPAEGLFDCEVRAAIQSRGLRAPHGAVAGEQATPEMQGIGSSRRLSRSCKQIAASFGALFICNEEACSDRMGHVFPRILLVASTYRYLTDYIRLRQFCAIIMAKRGQAPSRIPSS